MPFVCPGGDDTAHSGRKRRRDAADAKLFRLYAGPESQVDLFVRGSPAPDSVVSRKTLSLSKRLRIADDDTCRRRPPPPPPPQKPPHNDADLDGRTSARCSSALLSPCHICHRKPTKKSHLDSFAECQGCGERTCFVCVRECHGWQPDPLASMLPDPETMLSRSFPMDDIADSQPHPSPAPHEPSTPVCSDCDACEGRQYHHAADGWAAGGHRAVVCSRCCVERGGEGEVVCLGCLSGLPGT